MGRCPGKKLLDNLKSLMKNLELTAEAALKALSVPEQKWDYYIKQFSSEK